MIGRVAFYGSGVIEIHIPYSVEDPCEECFCGCKNLLLVTFGESSSLKLIGKRGFRGSGLSSFCLPGSVSSIGKSSFFGCSLKDFVIFDSN